MNMSSKIRNLKLRNPKLVEKPKKVMTIKGPFRKIDIYDQQPIANQVKIVQVFMEAEIAKEKLRSRV